MQPFTEIRGIAAPLTQANIDTDVIMPKQFLKGITRADLARGVFHDLRFDASGNRQEAFILNQSDYQHPVALVVGPNFGCGSSREHAVWGLTQFGVRCLLGSSFASIFQDNCARNGLLAVVLPPAEIGRLQEICADPQRNRITVNLQHQRIAVDGQPELAFQCDPLLRDDLLNGRDAIASTLQYSSEIAQFETAHWRARPWLRPVSA